MLEELSSFEAQVVNPTMCIVNTRADWSAAVVVQESCSTGCTTCSSRSADGTTSTEENSPENVVSSKVSRDLGECMLSAADERCICERCCGRVTTINVINVIRRVHCHL